MNERFFYKNKVTSILMNEITGLRIIQNVVIISGWGGLILFCTG
jgi:hypothetical protein